MKLSRDEVIQRLKDGNGSRDLSGLDLAGVDLSRMDLRGVNLSRADLSTADLRWAILEGADLHSTVLHRADCRWAILRGANLRQADLGRANLGWADVTGADLTGATMLGTNLENVDLGDGIVERSPGPREWMVGGLPGARAMPRSPATAVAAAAVGAAALTHLWGWMYRRAYFGAFDLRDPAVTGLGRWSNMRAGLGVLGLTVKTVLASPLVLLALAFLVALGLAVPALLVIFGDRALEPVPPARRTPVLVGLFILYFLVLWAGLLPAATGAAGWVFDRALPADEGLRSVFSLAASGGLLVGLGFAALAVAVATLLWFGWRGASRTIAVRDLPAAWRLRYPRLNAAYARARLSRVFSRHEALDPKERQQLVVAAAATAVLLPTLLSQTGGVAAFHDMCDGGELPRVQLYTGRQPEAEPADELICSRLLAETQDNYYVFFPSETARIDEGGPGPSGGGEETGAQEGEVAGGVVPLAGDAEGDDQDAAVPRDRMGLVRHQARVYKIARGEVVRRVDARGADNACVGCQGGPTGEERALVDPDELVAGGVVAAVQGRLVTLDRPTTTIASFELQPDTVFWSAGSPAGQADVVPGRTVRAFGSLSDTGDYILATRVVILSAAGPTYQPTIDVDLDAAQRAFTVRGSGWVPGSRVAAGLGPIGIDPPSPQTPFAEQGGEILVGPDGTFSAPMSFDLRYPTGPDLQVVVRDPQRGLAAAAPWFAEPPPTPMPTPTARPAPTEGPAATPPFPGTSPAPQATNTPLPTPRIPGGVGQCQPDDYEFDGGRGSEKEIYVGFSEGSETQEHNFCPAGDKDLVFFRVKKDRWYRVFTEGLAPGVDTVLSVGDLSPATRCQPAGCWNDDKAALTYASEVVFQALEDDRALVTVDNFGSASGNAATYSLAVLEFVPAATATATPQPSGTATVTPTSSPTPKPASDPGDDGLVQNNTCSNAWPLGLDPYWGTISRGTDQDWFKTITLGAGRYRVTLIPPKGLDLDLQVYEPGDPDRRACPGSLLGSSRNAGDATESKDLELMTSATFYVRVYPADSGQVDLHHQYMLQLSSLSPTQPVPPTATTTFTPAPTPTGTPTLSIPIPGP